MTPTRTALKPFSARNSASSLLNPLAAGSPGATLYTSLSPCRMTTCPSLLVSQSPVVPTDSSDPSGSEPARAAGQRAVVADHAVVAERTAAPPAPPRAARPPGWRCRRRCRHRRRCRTTSRRYHRHRRHRRRRRAAMPPMPSSEPPSPPAPPLAPAPPSPPSPPLPKKPPASRRNRRRHRLRRCPSRCRRHRTTIRRRRRWDLSTSRQHHYRSGTAQTPC